MGSVQNNLGSIDSPIDFEVFVEGVPLPQPRPRYSSRSGRFWSGASPAVDAWKDAVAVIALSAARGAGVPTATDSACALWLSFVMPRPRSVKRLAHTVKPDLDNLVKAVMDALSKARIWRDDAQVTRVVATKRYARVGEPAGCHIGIGTT